MKLYSIKDIKSGFNAPFVSANDEIAKRTFLDLCRDTNTTVGKFKEDFELWYIGEMSESKGTIEGEPEYLVGGRDYV